MTLTATVVVLTIFAACSSEDPAPAPAAPAPVSQASSRVVMFAEGEGTKSASVTLRTESGGTIQKDVSLPMGNKDTGEPGVPSDGFKPGDFLYLSVQNAEDTGSVTCRITAGDKVIDEATSTGSRVVATCQGHMP